VSRDGKLVVLNAESDDALHDSFESIKAAFNIPSQAPDDDFEAPIMSQTTTDHNLSTRVASMDPSS